MLSALQIFGGAHDKDPLSRWIPYSHFVDRDVFATKTGCVGMTLEMEGVEYETLSQDNIERVSQRFSAAHRGFDERFRIYHHLMKRDGERISRKGRYTNTVVNKAIHDRADFLERAGLYSIRIFTTIVLEAAPVKAKWRESLDEREALRALDRQLEENIKTIKDAVAAYAASLGPLLGVSILDRFGVFEHLCLLANPDPDLIPQLKYDTHLDYFAANSEMERSRRHLDWGGYEARIFALKEEPDSTFAHMLRGLLKIESNFTVAYEWKPVSTFAMTYKLRDKRKMTWMQRTSGVEKAEHAQADQAATEKANRLNEALAMIQADGHHFGEFSLIAVVFDRDADRLRRGVSALLSAFREKDATLLEEHVHRQRSFFAVFPGSKLNIRYRYLLNTNYADLVPLYRPRDGSEVNAHLDDEYLTVLQSMDGTPYYFNLHVGQVAASLLLGTTGSGKSVLMNQLIEDSQKYDGIYTFVVDIGGSYRGLTKKYGGTYVSVSLKERNFHINPFAQPYTPSNVNAIKQLILSFLANEKYEASGEERKQIDEAVHEVFALPESKRRLGKISLPKQLKSALHLWINNGALAHIFDNERDDLQLHRWSTWDYTDLEETPEVLAPLMYYQFHWIASIVRDPAHAAQPKGLWMDEGWRFGGSAMADLIRTAAKTWRKHNAWVVFATQDEIDLRSSGLLEVLTSACHTKLFLPNPGADLGLYGTTFKLTARERELLGEMRTGEFLLKTQRESRRCRLRWSQTQLEEYAAQFAHADLVEAV